MFGSRYVVFNRVVRYTCSPAFLLKRGGKKPKTALGTELAEKQRTDNGTDEENNMSERAMRVLFGIN